MNDLAQLDQFVAGIRGLIPAFVDEAATVLAANQGDTSRVVQLYASHFDRTLCAHQIAGLAAVLIVDAAARRAGAVRDA